MNVLSSTRRTVAAAVLGVGLLAAPGIASAAPATPVHSVVVHTPATKVPKTYTVIAGTYTTQAKADARLAKITAKGITGMTVFVKTGKTAKSTRYVVQQSGMTLADAKVLYKQLRKAHFTAHYVAH